MSNLDVITEKSVINELIENAFKEDIGPGDVTTNAIVSEDIRAKAIWLAKESGVIAGLQLAEKVFQKLDPQINWTSRLSDGDQVQEGDIITELEGSCRAILTGERIALNFIQRMSGIASLTRKFVDAIKDYPTEMLDTRKTIPGLRYLDKYAVSAGGGTNHRMGLYDMAMIKDNHIVAAGSITKAVEMVRKNSSIKIEVETTNLDQVREAMTEDVDIIMLDNMSSEQMRKAITIIDGRAKTEASGNITLETVREVASTGVDYISAGVLTHSVKAFDISQQIKKIY
jgi:nicotinate-nucleotide pyrophosphorylase (carboxylating)